MPQSSDEPFDITRAPEPPWQRYPGRDPWWGGFRQGDAEPWYLNVFLPFWTGLGSARQHEYLERWPPPNPEWAGCLADYAARGPVANEFSEAPIPPWERYSGHGPLWVGWFAGSAKRFLREVFLPFWSALPAHDRAAYLRVWPPPSDAWRERLQRE